VPEPEPTPTPVAEEAAAEKPVAEEPAAEADRGAEEALPETAAEEPAVEAAPAAEVEEGEPAGPPSQRGPKPKKKRLPRAKRPQRTKPKREPATARTPIVRLPKPEGERGRRQQRRGVVVSAAMDKTIVVRVDSVKAHPKYKKVIRRSRKFQAHDDTNRAKAGDVVRIVETRPLSKTKRWRLAEIIEVEK
jgi:small subunit ribosomal protein S17